MLVSKKVSVIQGHGAVELLAGEELEQSYELFIDTDAAAPVWIGDSLVSPTTSAPLNHAGPFRIRGESLWAISSASGSLTATLSVLAYSTE